MLCPTPSEAESWSQYMSGGSAEIIPLLPGYACVAEWVLEHKMGPACLFPRVPTVVGLTNAECHKLSLFVLSPVTPVRLVLLTILWLLVLTGTNFGSRRINCE